MIALWAGCEGGARMIKQTFYQLPEDQCERLNRSEMNALKWCLAAVNSVAYAEDDLADRLECIPSGKARWRLMLGQMRACINDIIGTIPRKQGNTIRNLMNDMELRMVPKYTAYDRRVIMDVEDLSYLVAHAKKDESLCMTCTYTGDECRQCELYKTLEAIALQEHWEKDSMICPYNREDWYEK